MQIRQTSVLPGQSFQLLLALPLPYARCATLYPQPDERSGNAGDADKLRGSISA
jgi:hypothetical protein